MKELESELELLEQSEILKRPCYTVTFATHDFKTNTFKFMPPGHFS